MKLQKKHLIMKSDVREKEDMYIVDVDLPGFKKEDIKAYVKSNYLIITASRKTESSADLNSYIRKERYNGEYTRSFYIGSMVNEVDIKASYQNGVLKILIPKNKVEKIQERKVIAIA